MTPAIYTIMMRFNFRRANTAAEPVKLTQMANYNHNDNNNNHHNHHNHHKHHNNHNHHPSAHSAPPEPIHRRVFDGIRNVMQLKQSGTCGSCK
jgi:hypothetical protein